MDTDTLPTRSAADDPMVRLAVAAHLARYKGQSRAHTRWSGYWGAIWGDQHSTAANTRDLLTNEGPLDKAFLIYEREQWEASELTTSPRTRTRTSGGTGRRLGRQGS